MSNQEQQFYRPEHYPQSQYSEERSSENVDPREQTMYGGPEYYTRPGEKLQPQIARRRRKGLRPFWLVTTLLIIIVAAVSLNHSQNSSNKYSHSSSIDQTFTVLTAPKLVINDSAGSIRVHTNSNSSGGNAVTIHVDKSSDSIANPTINFDKQAGTIVINATQSGANDNSVDIDITTPNVSSIQLNDGNGSVSIDGVIGNIDAHTNNGSINADHITGQVVLSTGHGSVDVSDSQLSGTSSLTSSDDDIDFNGSLNINGTYKFTTGNGSLDVTLPSDASFSLKADSGSGSVNNDFGSDTVGSGTHPSLTLHTNNGSIEVHKG
jgi:hypothetical protein